jgi:putative hydrolase of the HAD superfamily
MRPVQAVIFDLGGVLVTVDFDQLWSHITGCTGHAIPPERLVADDLVRRYCTGRLTPRELHREIGARTGWSPPWDEFVTRWCGIFGVMPGMPELLAEVAARVPVGLLSDTDPLHWAHQIRHYPHVAAIPNPTLSFRIGVMKPDPEAFRLAAANVGRPMDACLFVDDLQRNVDGARQVGMTAVRFRGAEALRDELARLGVLG